MRPRLIAAACAAVLGSATAAPGQGAATDSVRCAQAVNFVRAYDHAMIESGGHAVETGGKSEQRQLAAAQLLTCGAEGGRVAAATIRSARFLTDRPSLNELVGPFDDFRDTAVVNASMDVAADPSASIEARVFALRTLWVVRTGKFWIVYDRMLPTSESTSAHPVAACDDGLEVTDAKPAWSRGVEPPPGFDAEIVALANRLAADPSQPMGVRAAATCASRP